MTEEVREPGAELRALAEKATPGPWEKPDPAYDVAVWQVKSGGAVCYVNFDNETGDHHPAADAAYIAAASPDVILRLLDRLAATEAVVEAARRVLPERMSGDFPSVVAQPFDFEASQRILVAKADRWQALRAALDAVEGGKP